MYVTAAKTNLSVNFIMYDNITQMPSVINKQCI